MTKAERRDIDGIARTVWEMFNNRRYKLDTFQREYKWQSKQVTELLEDLSSRFLEEYEPDHERAEVARYGHYFLGSIVISQRDGDAYIIDGQQRLTTLTLLLIYLRQRQADFDDDNKVEFDALIVTKKFGKRSFNMDVETRTACLEALLAGQQNSLPGKQSEAVENMLARYKDIEHDFPGEINDSALPYFIDWLLNNVHVVEITAYSDEDAYTIFETMNDRGLSLAPLDMLKGFVMASIVDEKDRARANSEWRQSLEPLRELGRDEEADAVKAWLRSQYATTIRERRKGAKPGDFDRLGTEFHRWVRDHEKEIGLKNSRDFLQFVSCNLKFYATQQLRLRQGSITTTPGLETVRHIAALGFTLQYPLLLSPLVPSDSPEVIDRKVRVVATYIDIVLARRLWNFRLIAYSTLVYAMFLVMRDVRGKTLAELVDLLHDRLDAEHETFSSNGNLRLHQQNRYTLHWLLARLTDWVGVNSGQHSRFEDYMSEGKGRYEIEHIWANHPERFQDEFPHEADFREYRNRIGGLLIVPKAFNASYGDLPYKDKLPHYLKQNLLAQSLHPDAYSHDPGFKQLLGATGLPFKDHPNFRRADLDARQQLYVKIAEQVWSPSRLQDTAL